MSGRKLYKKNKMMHGHQLHTVQQPHVSSVAPKSSPKSTLILAAVLLIIGLIVVLFLRSQVTTNNNLQTEQDYTAITQEALPFLDTTKYKDLGVIVEKIKNIEGYSSNVNLQYIVTIYSLYSNDITAAKTNLAQLESIYDPSKGYNEILQQKALSIEQIKRSITFAENKIKEYDANVILIPDGLPQ